MAKINVTKKWDEARGRYVPDQYSIEGEGPISITYAFMNEADPEFVQYDAENHLIIIGPYTLEVIAQSRNIDGEYVCKVING